MLNNNTKIKVMKAILTYYHNNNHVTRKKCFSPDALRYATTQLAADDPMRQGALDIACRDFVATTGQEQLEEYLKVLDSETGQQLMKGVIEHFDVNGRVIGWIFYCRYGFEDEGFTVAAAW